MLVYNPAVKPGEFKRNPERTKAMYRKMAKPVRVGEEVYPTLRAASAALNCSANIIGLHLRRKTLFRGMVVEKA